jgi:hypothetical protein
VVRIPEDTVKVTEGKEAQGKAAIEAALKIITDNFAHIKSGAHDAFVRESVEKIIVESGLSMEDCSLLFKSIPIFALEQQIKQGDPASIWRAIDYCNVLNIEYPKQIRDYLGTVSEAFSHMGRTADSGNEGTAIYQSLGWSGWQDFKSGYSVEDIATVQIFHYVVKHCEGSEGKRSRRTERKTLIDAVAEKMGKQGCTLALIQLSRS